MSVTSKGFGGSRPDHVVGLRVRVCSNASARGRRCAWRSAPVRPPTASFRSSRASPIWGSGIGYWGMSEHSENRSPGRDYGSGHGGVGGAARVPVPRLGERAGGNCTGRARAWPPPAGCSASRGGRDRGAGDAGADGRRGLSWGRARVRVDAAGGALAWRLRGVVGAVCLARSVAEGRASPGVLGAVVIALTYLMPAAGRAIEARATAAGDAAVMRACLGGVLFEVLGRSGHRLSWERRRRLQASPRSGPSTVARPAPESSARPLHLVRS